MTLKQKYLKRVANGEVEGGVAVPVGRDEGPWPLSHRRIMRLHAEVEAKEEVVEVHSDTKTIGSSKLLVELIKSKDSSLLEGIIAYGPDVAYIDEGPKFEHPEEFCSILGTCYQSDIATLVDEVTHGVAPGVGSRTKSTHRPSTHSVGTSAIKTLLKRQHLRVAIRHTDSAAYTECHGIPLVETMEKRIVSLQFEILGIVYSEDFVGIFMEVAAMGEDTRYCKEKVAGDLRINSHVVNVALH